ncbi:MAG: hypothetical protein AXA67_01080 [Methylothermaceae bacteria B42]|nr:MAG: hypothetical protein AXA67_01080 [Methylothermaceae bacteria B42]HHJ40471.1 hypothetical protein [Methylothermaceae bacterium]
MKQVGLMVMATLVLMGCGDQAREMLDKNPEYAGKRDKHANVIPEKDKVLRRRVLMGQMDR